MNLVFMGTSEFAVPALEKLAASTAHRLMAVVTQPDRPGHRGRIQAPPVKDVAIAAGAIATAGMALVAAAPGPLTLAAGVLLAGASSGLASPPLDSCSSSRWEFRLT